MLSQVCAAEPFWAHVERRGVPVFLHPPLLPYGFRSMTKYRLEEAVGRPADTALSVARLIFSGTFDRHPNLKVVLAHVGGALLAAMGRLEFTYRLGYDGLPEGEAAVCERPPSEYLPRSLYVDTMGFWAPHVREAIEVLGADRVLLGSDFGPVPISPAEPSISSGHSVSTRRTNSGSSAATQRRCSGWTYDQEPLETNGNSEVGPVRKVPATD